jgi:hypothetical protein
MMPGLPSRNLRRKSLMAVMREEAIAAKVKGGVVVGVKKSAGPPSPQP